jgi:hypothetical protein
MFSASPLLRSELILETLHEVCNLEMETVKNDEEKKGK